MGVLGVATKAGSQGLGTPGARLEGQRTGSRKLGGADAIVLSVDTGDVLEVGSDLNGQQLQSTTPSQELLSYLSDSEPG